MDTASAPSDPLVPLGWDAGWAALVDAVDRSGARAGRVGRVDRGLVTIATRAGAVRAPASVELRDGDSLDLPATGDWVVVAASELDTAPDGVEVVAVLPRRTSFVRGDPMDGKARGAQVLAANLDTVFVVHALSNGPNLRRLERELVLTFESGAMPVVVLNKADLVDDATATAAVRAVESVAPAVSVEVASSVTAEGVDVLRAYAHPNRTIALIGASGVGKSTLVNAIVGDDVQATGAVREGDQRGRHTTTTRDLIPLADGGVLVDTPGLRAVSLWDADDGFALAFADIEELAVDCRFRDCAHDREPGCAVRAAVDDGRLDAARLESYLRLDDELERLAVQADARARAEKKRSDRSFSKMIRAMPKRGL